MGDALTKGARALNRFLDGENPLGKPITNAEAGRGIGVSRITILNWRRGRITPEDPRRLAIQRWSAGAIQVAWWADEGERDLMSRAAKVSPLTAQPAKGKRARAAA